MFQTYLDIIGVLTFCEHDKSCVDDEHHLSRAGCRVTSRIDGITLYPRCQHLALWQSFYYMFHV